MCDTDIIRKHSGSLYVKPEFIELYSFEKKQIKKIVNRYNIPL